MSIINSHVGFSAVQNAQTGIARGMSALDRDVAVIANASSGAGLSEDVVGALIDASQQRLYIQASAKALSIADEAMSAALGQLVDTHA